jgi:C_GCAxxG_C_C family probable redox protein
MKFASGFGGGMGGMKEVCGVLSGAFMVLGAAKGFTDTSTKEEKDAFMGTIKAFADEFRSQYGSMMCRDLVETSKEESFLGEKAQDDFFVSKPCAVYVEQASEMLDRYLTD